MSHRRIEGWGLFCGRSMLRLVQNLLAFRTDVLFLRASCYYCVRLCCVWGACARSVCACVRVRVGVFACEFQVFFHTHRHTAKLYLTFVVLELARFKFGELRVWRVLGACESVIPTSIMESISSIRFSMTDNRCHNTLLTT